MWQGIGLMGKPIRQHQGGVVWTYVWMYVRTYIWMYVRYGFPHKDFIGDRPFGSDAQKENDRGGTDMKALMVIDILMPI
jgi:hypothetical protein